MLKCLYLCDGVFAPPHSADIIERKTRPSMGFLSKLLTLGEGKQLKRYEAMVQKINGLEPSMQALSDEELAGLTEQFRARFAAGESLDDLLPEAFAAVREARDRKSVV